MNFTDCLSSLLFWISLVVAVIITALITILNPKKQKGALVGGALDLSCLNPSKQDATFKVVAKSDPNPTPRSSICPAEGPGGSCNVLAAYGPIPGLETGVPGCASHVVGDSDGNCIWTQSPAGGCKFLSSDCDVTALDKCPILAKGACSKCKNGALCGKTDFRNTYYCDGHGSCDNGTSCDSCDPGYSKSASGGCVKPSSKYYCKITGDESGNCRLVSNVTWKNQGCASIDGYNDKFSCEKECLPKNSYGDCPPYKHDVGYCTDKGTNPLILGEGQWCGCHALSETGGLDGCYQAGGCSGDCEIVKVKCLTGEDPSCSTTGIFGGGGCEC